MNNLKCILGILTWVVAIILGVTQPLTAQWTDISFGLTNDLKSVYFVDENEGWIVGDNNEIWHTTNGGVSWLAQDGDFNPNVVEDFYGVHLFDSNTGWIAGGFDINAGFVLHTSVGGTMPWDPQPVPAVNPALYSIDFADANNGCAVGGFDDFGIAVSTFDGGTTWVLSIDGTVEPLGVVAPIIRGVSTPHILEWWLVGDDATIWHTTTGGPPYDQEATPLPVTDHLYAVDFINSTSTGWAVGGNIGRGVVIHRPGVLPWELQVDGSVGGNSIPLLRSVSFPNSNSGWAVGDGGIIVHTDNGGSNWIKQLSGIVTNLNSVYFPSANVGWAVGDEGTVLKYQAPTPGPHEGEEVFIYSAKFVCGTSRDIKETSIARGIYATVVNIHNFSDSTIVVRKKGVLALTQFEEPIPPTNKDTVRVEPDGAFEVDCREISDWFNLPPDQLATGFVVIESPVRLDVVAVYTTEGLPDFPPTAPSIDVEYVPESHVEDTSEPGEPDIIIIIIVIVILLIILILLVILLRRK